MRSRVVGTAGTRWPFCFFSSIAFRGIPSNEAGTFLVSPRRVQRIVSGVHRTIIAGSESSALSIRPLLPSSERDARARLATIINAFRSRKDAAPAVHPDFVSHDYLGNLSLINHAFAFNLGPKINTPFSND